MELSARTLNRTLLARQVCSTVFADGMLEGLWRLEDGRPVVVDLFCDLTRAERVGSTTSWTG